MASFRQEYEKMVSEIPTSRIARTLGGLKDDLGGRPLALYGAGRLAGAILEHCQECGLPVTCVCDRAKTGVFVGVGGGDLPIIPPQTLRRDYPQAVVVICSFIYNDEIYSGLVQNGFTPEQIVRHPVRHPYFETLRTFGRHLDGYGWAHDFFGDTVSRQTVLDRMGLLLLDEPMRPNTPCTMYYEDGFIALSENEVYVDGGAYDGDTVETFILKMRETGKPYSRAYAFEPSPTSCAKVVRRLSDCPNVEIVQKGLWSAEKELSFFENSANMGGASASFVIGSGSGNAVPVTSLDVFFQGRPDGELPTFIKMDIEGAEKDALLGAADIIRRKKPKLSICAYHKPEDVYELPQTIKGIRDDYRFALRQHCDGAYDTVLYAV